MDIYQKAPTLNCNMACPYCYENKNQKRMNIEVQEELYRFTENYIKTNNIKNIHVTWYGGEPLLEKEIIYSLSERLIKLCDSNSVGYKASIITNGVLLDRETASHLKDKCKVNMAQVTIDGMPEFHNKRRILIDGRDSFDIIVENIENCKDLLPISVRVNVDKDNQEGIDNLVDYFLNDKKWIKNPKFYLAPVEVYSDSCGISKTTCLQSDEFASLDVRCLKSIYSHDRDLAISEIYPIHGNNFCGANNLGTFVVDPEGYLYTCWNMVGIIEKSIGNISDNFEITSEYMKWLLLEPKEKCLTCKYYPICLGGCPYHMIQKNEPNCHSKIYSLEEKLKLAYEDYLLHNNSESI